MLYVLTTLIIKKLKKETDAIATITSSEKQDCSVSKYECLDLIAYSFKQICILWILYIPQNVSYH